MDPVSLNHCNKWPSKQPSWVGRVSHQGRNRTPNPVTLLVRKAHPHTRDLMTDHHMHTASWSNVVTTMSRHILSPGTGQVTIDTKLGDLSISKAVQFPLSGKEMLLHERQFKRRQNRFWNSGHYPCLAGGSPRFSKMCSVVTEKFSSSGIKAIKSMIPTALRVLHPLSPFNPHTLRARWHSAISSQTAQSESQIHPWLLCVK